MRTNSVTSISTHKPDLRRSKRFRFHVDVDVSDRRGVRRGHAVDVARHGLFISIVDPPHNRHLVQLVIHLPSGPMQAAATVSRTLAGQGVGLALFSLSDDAKRRWDTFIVDLQQQEQQTVAAESSRPGTGAPSFLLRLRTMERLREFQNTHVVVGGTVLFTPVLLPEGSPVTIVVVHPVSHEEHLLPGRVHRSIATTPKRLEILFDAIDHDAFGRFVESGLMQLPTIVGSPEPVILAPVEEVLNTARATEDDDDLDIEVLDEEMQEDPIEWDLQTSDLPNLRAQQTASVPIAAPLIDAAAAAAIAAAVAADDDDDGVVAADDLLIDESSSARDPGLRPTPVRICCDACDAQSYNIEFGPCAGALGLVADLVPFWSAEQERVVSVPRLIDARTRQQRFQLYIERGGAIEDVLPLSTFLAAADLAEPPDHPESGESLKSSRPIERLALAARRVAEEDVVAPTRVKCPHCRDGHLSLERA